MTKRLLLCLMCIVFVLSFASCSKKEAVSEKPKSTASTEENPATEGDSENNESEGKKLDIGKIDFHIEPVEPAKVKEIDWDEITENIKMEEIDISVDSVEMSDASKFDKLTDEQKLKLKEQYAVVIYDIKTGFESAGFDVDVNESTGEVAVDAAVLFASDEYEVTNEGEDFLKDFLGVYVPVITKHSDFIANVMVEGHTDTEGNYDYNMELSKKRAGSVLNCCKSDKSGLGSKDLSTVTSKFKAVGRSYDNPVYGDDGKVDMAASRRVTFRFIVNLD